MKKKRSKRSDKFGLPPGSPVHVGEVPCRPVNIQVMDYDANTCTEWHGRAEAAADMPSRKAAVRWIHLDGAHNAELVQRLGRQQGLRDLTIEDLLNSEQRPKMDECSDSIFLVLKYPVLAADGVRVELELLNLILGPNTVFSLAIGEHAPLTPLRDRIREGRGRVRQRGADYLAYCLLDLVVDSFFHLVERLEDEIDQLQETVLQGKSSGFAVRMQQLRVAVQQLLRVARPMHDLLAALHRKDSPLMQPATQPYLADVLDHLSSIVDSGEHFRATLDAMMEIHLATMSNNMNQVIKLLTTFTAVFMPLSFLAGVYGMNFRHMPGLENPVGVYIILAVMLLLGLGMLFFFRRHKWL
ncbi:MAG: magnesium and cobalt transport protein CorA [Desulfobulbaceae bacterium A2]|nr:MAG: magnesium and cobalt transport protein CorA [Desulfobulbaceae bacterium A2]